MTNEDDTRYAKVDAKLQTVAEASATPPPWCDAWKRLGPDSTEEDRLAVYQAVRQAESLPEAASFWLVSLLIDEIATRDVDDALGHYEARLHAIEEAYELEEGGIWPAGAAPAGYAELREEYHRAWDELFIVKLDEFGEQEMARLFRDHHERFEQLSEEGREYFYGPESAEDLAPLVWLRRLVGVVAHCMTADSPMGPLGYRYGEDEGCWKIDVYPKPVELVGGAEDGEIVAPGFSLHLEELRAEFEQIAACSWQSLGYPDGEGPHVSIEGVYQGHEVFVQVLAYAPEDEEPGMKLDTRPPSK